MGSKFEYWFNEIIVWFITTVIFAVGLLTWDYYMDTNGLSFVWHVVCIGLGMIVTYPTYSFWEKKIKQFFNRLDNE